MIKIVYLQGQKQSSILKIDSPSRKLWLGVVCAALATIIWSGNYIIARILNDKVPPVSLAFWRWLVGTVVLIPFALKTLIREREIIKNHILFLLIVAITGVTIFNTLLYLAGQTTTAINLSLLSLTFPIFTIVLARIFLKELITNSKIAGVILVIFGVLVLLSKGDVTMLASISFVPGDIWMILASFVFAVYSLLLRFKPKQLSAIGILGSTFIIGLILLLPFYLWEKSVTETIIYDKVVILSFLYIGIFASLIAYFLWNYSVELIGPTKASLIYYSIPIFSGILAFIFLKEEIGMVHLISGLLIFSGILVASISK